MQEAHIEKTEVKPGQPGAKKRKKRGKRLLRAALTLVVLIAVGTGGYLYYQNQIKSSAGEEESYLLQPVLMGTIRKTVFGSGMVQAADQPTILANTTGTVVSVPVSIGDAVTKGQVLAVLENDELDEEIQSLEYSLWEKDISISSSVMGTEVTGVKAPVSGRVMQVNVSTGDDALATYRQHGSVVILSTDGRMKVDFAVEDNAPLALGDDVTVHGDGFTAAATITDLYMQGMNATATILGDELPLDAPVWIEHRDVQVGHGLLAINKPMAVSAHGGTVDEVRVRVGDLVSQKMTLLTLKDAPISLEMENLRMQRESISDSLRNAIARREGLILVAPSDGVIASLNLSVGDSVQSGTVAMSMIVGEEMVLSIAVDELDVVEVAPGQPVAISVDALPNLSIAGIVEKIAPVGSGSSGVSTYDVSLNFTAEGTGVMPGMNASGAVEVAMAENALYVPVEALLTVGNQQFVMVYEQAATDAADAIDATDAASSTDTEGDPTTAPQENGGAPYGRRGAVGTGVASNEGEAPGANMPAGRTGGSFPGGGQLPEGMDAEQLAQMRENFASMGAEGGMRGQGGASMSMTAPLTGTTDTTGAAGTLRAVTTGIQNDDYVQILSGLSAGEIVMYQMTGSSASNASMLRMGGGAVTSVGGGFFTR